MGKCIWDNYMYEGWWFRDLRKGMGREISGEGFEYEGEWEHDMIKGSGRMTWNTSRK